MFAEVSSKTVGGQNQSIEVRVWVHLDRPVMTEDELRNKFFDFIEMLDLRESVIQERGLELNREIDKDEMLPTGEIGKWWGVAKFHVERAKGSYDKDYFGENSGDGWKASSSFRIPAGLGEAI